MNFFDSIVISHMGHLVLDKWTRDTKKPRRSRAGVVCESSAGGLIRNHTSCPAFPDGGSCMAFSSLVELQAPRQVIRVLDEPKGHNLNEVR